MRAILRFTLATTFMAAAGCAGAPPGAQGNAAGGDGKADTSAPVMHKNDAPLAEDLSGHRYKSTASKKRPLDDCNDDSPAPTTPMGSSPPGG
jgi:hypothetical protein